MTYDNRVAEIAPLGLPILEEVVREGEAMLAAQLTVATAADQRAMTFAGLLIAAATAATGGVIALVLSDKPAWTVVVIGTVYATAAIVAAGLAIWSAKPSAFSFPGNEPALWHPDLWQVGIGGPHSIHQARVEQAVNLQSQIGKNKNALSRNARWMRAAVLLGFTSTALAAISTGIWGLGHWRHYKPPVAPITTRSPPIGSCCCNKEAPTYRRFREKRSSIDATGPRKNSQRLHTHQPKRAVRSVRLPAVRECKPSHPATAE
jgi:hypothetical protein